jgi:hypothetical protein
VSGSTFDLDQIQKNSLSKFMIGLQRKALACCIHNTEEPMDYAGTLHMASFIAPITQDESLNGFTQCRLGDERSKKQKATDFKNQWLLNW